MTDNWEKSTVNPVVDSRHPWKKGFIHTEEKTKVVAAVWGTEFIQIVVAIACPRMI